MPIRRIETAGDHYLVEEGQVYGKTYGGGKTFDFEIRFYNMKYG
jgi:hypothetical protein